MGVVMQQGALLVMPLTAVIQTCRYMNKGPPDILEVFIYIITITYIYCSMGFCGLFTYSYVFICCKDYEASDCVEELVGSFVFYSISYRVYYLLKKILVSILIQIIIGIHFFVVILCFLLFLYYISYSDFL